MPPDMPAPKFRPVGPSTTTRPPVMYSQAWSPTPSTTAVAPELRTANRSPTTPRMNTSPLVAPYRMTLPAMMFSSATNVRRGRRAADHDAPARQALAHVVVGVALQVQGDPPGQEGAQALAGRAGQRHGDGVVGQALAAVAAGELVAEHGAHRAVDVGDGRGGCRPARPARGPAPHCSMRRAVEGLDQTRGPAR